MHQFHAYFHHYCFGFHIFLFRWIKSSTRFPSALLRLESSKDRVWSVSVWKSRYTEMASKVRATGSPCSVVMHPPDVVHPHDLFDWFADLVWWVSVWKSGYGETRTKVRERVSPCSVVMHRPNVVLLCLRFDCSRDSVWWVSVWKSGYGEQRRKVRERGSLYSVVMHRPDVVLP